MDKGPTETSVKLLLACLDPSGKAWARVLNESSRRVDWPWVLERARAHKLIGLVTAWGLAPDFRGMVPDYAREQLEAEREAGRIHRDRVARTLVETRERLSDLDCPFLVVKGSVYSHDLYEDPSIRRFSDIDIVIPHERLEDVDQAFKRDGYYFWAHPRIHKDLPRWFKKKAPAGEKPGSEAAAKRILAAFHRHHLYVLRKEDPRMHVEVHWHFLVPEQGRATSRDVWAETRTTNLEGVETRTLNREASLLHAAVHAMEQPPNECRLLHLCDVAWMLKRWKGVIDGRRLRDLTDSWGLARFLHAAISAVDLVSPGDLNEEPRQVWPDSNPVRRTLLHGAGFGPWLVEQPASGGRLRQLAENTSREILWEIALGRWPTTAVGRLSRAVRVHLPALGLGSRDLPLGTD